MQNLARHFQALAPAQSCSEGSADRGRGEAVVLDMFSEPPPADKSLLVFEWEMVLQGACPYFHSSLPTRLSHLKAISKKKADDVSRFSSW